MRYGDIPGVTILTIRAQI